MTALRKTPIALAPKAAPFAIRAETASDVVAREALLDACFGENRHARTCQRLRDGRAPADRPCAVGGARGPAGRDLAVVARQRRGHRGARARPAGGRQRLPQARRRRRADAPTRLRRRQARGHRAVILLGDAPYYARFGFSADEDRRADRCPAPFERERLLGLELRRRRARRRLGHDRADRRFAAQIEGSADAEVASRRPRPQRDGRDTAPSP